MTHEDPTLILRAIMRRNPTENERLAIADATLSVGRDFHHTYDLEALDRIPVIMTMEDALDACTDYATDGERIAYAVTHRALYRLLARATLATQR